LSRATGPTVFDLRGKRVAVVGLGASGVAAARLCLGRGAHVVGCDEAARDRLGAEARALEAAGVRIECGPLRAEALSEADVVVVSPGVPEREAVTAAERRGREVIGEIELAARFFTAPIGLVGGTNGKSTVTALVGAMMEASGARTFVGGNYGTPFSAAVDAGYEVAVVEISSFQAERVPTLRARVHALLNVTEDHLDRYPGFDAYARAKGNPFENMGPDDVAVVPAGDAICEAQAARGRARRVRFAAAPGAGDVAPTEDLAGIVDRASGRRYPLAGFRLRGRHNLANACAAAATAAALGAPEQAVARALATFEGLAHRHTLIAEIGGVRFYDDSKGTNVGAVVAALGGLDEARAVLIAGGRDKLGAYQPLVEALRARGRALVLLGEAAERIAAAARAGGLAVAVERAASMDEAVRIAAALARPGDAVLLSPACSSFDMFRSYKERGEAFSAAVARLAAEEGGAR
jgi:UDP-N-acetylmuramoylalanine--D-glutamate ligase